MLQRITKAATLLNSARSFLSNSELWCDYLDWYSKHGGWIQHYRDLYSEQDCFILCNGPSLNRVDLAKLNYYHCIGLNKIYMLFERVKLNLTFHVAVNKLVIEQSLQEFTKLECPSFISYQVARHDLKQANNINYIYAEHRVAPRFSRVYDEPIWEGYTVTNVALQLAFFMGFQNVFIIGMDHSFATSGKPNEQQLLQGNDSNHFDPNYFAGCQLHLPDLEGSELSYRMAQFAYQRSGRCIYDATVGGKCTIFSKINMNEAFDVCKKRG